MPQTIEERKAYHREYKRRYRKKYPGIDRKYENPEKRKKQGRKWCEKNTLYRTWSMMKQRCFNPKSNNYHHYGGRGITIYEPWIKDRKAFENYILETLGPRPTPEYTLDRINNNEGYYPGNLRWATPKEQAVNRRSRLIREYWECSREATLAPPSPYQGTREKSKSEGMQ